MRQWRTFKEQYPEYVLLFRMGDFYELFGDDAKIASRVLGLALTSRSKGDGAIPLAGMPYHALDNYLGRLIAAGHRVAICEQVEDAKEAKGVVKRDVTRLITPGTLTDESLLEQRQGNYLAAVYSAAGGQAGIAWVELSSGAFWAMEVQADHLLDELVRIAPAEVLLPEDTPFDTKAHHEQIRDTLNAAPTPRGQWTFDQHTAEKTLCEHFDVKTLDGFGFTEWDPSLNAAGAILAYLNDTQKNALDHILQLRRFDRSDHMTIDANTLRCNRRLRLFFPESQSCLFP